MSKVQKIEIINWYIIQGLLNGDVLIDGYYQFKQFNIIKFDQPTNKIWLTIHETYAEVNQDLTPKEKTHQLSIGTPTEKGDFALKIYGAILKWDKIDKWFVTNKKIDTFKKVLSQTI